MSSKAESNVSKQRTCRSVTVAQGLQEIESEIDALKMIDIVPSIATRTKEQVSWLRQCVPMSKFSSQESECIPQCMFSFYLFVVHIYISSSIYLSIHTYIHTKTRPSIHPPIHTYIPHQLPFTPPPYLQSVHRTSKHTYIHIYIHTYMYISLYTHMQYMQYASC